MSKRRERNQRPEIKEEGEPKIPLEPTVRPQWLAWRIESRKGEPTKVPYSPNVGGLASVSDPRTWGTYEQASAFCEEQGMDGIGYVFSAEDPYTGIDLDHCRDPETGAIEAWAQDIITDLSSYTEVSPSGGGLHIVIKGKLPSEGRRKDWLDPNDGHKRGIEAYDSGRYFTMTGLHLEGTPQSIEPRQAELEALHRQVWPELYEAGAREVLRASMATERHTDEEVLGKALGAKNGEKFARLWTGDISDYDGDHSRADLALCRMLAFYTRNSEQIDRLFRRSGLIRWKWDEKRGGQTYGEVTIAKAMAAITNVYTGGLARKGDGVSMGNIGEQEINSAEDWQQRMAERLLKIHVLQDELTSSPYSHDVLELALAAATSLPVFEQNQSGLVWMLVVGVPSSDKTQTVLLLQGAPNTFYLDSLTENSFVSGFTVDGKPGSKDLLPELDGKCLVVKDLTTLFSLREDKVKKILGDLQSIYDGEYVKATGTLGVVGYKSRFTLLGCITPSALTQHHVYLGRIGPRFLYYRVPGLTEEQREEGFDVIFEEKEHKEILRELRRLIAEHVKELLVLPPDLVKETTGQQRVLTRLAELLACGRGTTSWGRDQEGQWEIEEVQIEEPFRALQQLRTLGRALARLHGRTSVTDHELEILRRVVLSSLATKRCDVLAVFRDYPDGLTTKACQERIGKSER